MIYYVEKDGKIIKSTPFVKVAKSWGESYETTDKELVYGYDNQLHFEDDIPEKPKDIKENEVRQIRNNYLTETDKFLSISDFPITEEQKTKYREYRQYLREYPQSSEDWYLSAPKSFEDWNK